MFLLVSVILLTGGGLPQCMLGFHPLEADNPLEQTHPPKAGTPQKQTPPRADIPPEADLPRGRHPPGGRPPKQTPPGSRPPEQTPPWEAESSIWSMSSQYASYWNAFFLSILIPCNIQNTHYSVLHTLSQIASKGVIYKKILLQIAPRSVTYRILTVTDCTH